MAWLSNWKKRVKIDIDQTNIVGSHSNFPVLLYLSTSSGVNSEDISFVFDEIGSNDNRKKIAVTKEDGTTQCYVEIERWDQSSEKAWLFAKIPEVNGDANDWSSPSANGDDYTEYIDPQKMYSSNDDRGKSTAPDQQHDFYNFNLDIGSDNISGIEVAIEGNNNSVSIGQDVELSWDGGMTYTTSGYGATWPLSGIDSIETFGSSSDLWGRNSWSASDFSNANFRVRLTSTGVSGDFYIDHIKVKIHLSQTSFYLYYDSSKADNTTYVEDFGSRTEVWDSNFKGVWHLDEQGSGGDTGFHNPSANGDDYSQFTDPQKMYTSNDDRGKSTASGQQHDFYDFNLGVISAPIAGIEVQVEGNNNNQTAGLDIELSWDGGITYTTTGYGATWPLGSIDSIETFGGSTNLWGRSSWSQSEFLNANFRVRLTSTGGEVDFFIDHIQVKVYYETHNYEESTSNNRDGVGAILNPDQIDGKVGKGQNFNSTDTEWIDINSALSNFISAGTGTMSVLIRPTGSSPSVSNYYTGQHIMGDSNGQAAITRGTIGGSDRIWCGNWDTEEDRVGITYTVDIWTYITWKHEGGTLYAYKNGQSIGSISSGNTGNLTNDVQIGYGDDMGEYFNGDIDEIRISDNDRTLEWEKVTYESLFDNLLDFYEEEIYRENAIFFGCNF